MLSAMRNQPVNNSELGRRRAHHLTVSSSSLCLKLLRYGLRGNLDRRCGRRFIVDQKATSGARDGLAPAANTW